jgi:hypothetical protein
MAASWCACCGDDSESPRSHSAADSSSVGAPLYVPSWRAPPETHILTSVAESNQSFARSLLSEIDQLDAPDDATTRSLAQKYYSAVVTNICLRFECAPSSAQIRALELLQVASLCRSGDVWAALAQRSATDAHRIDSAKAELRLLLTEMISLSAVGSV